MIAPRGGRSLPGIIVADDAGALLVRSGLVTTSALEAARANVAAAGGTLGEHLVGAGAIADDALTGFYRERLLVTQVNPNLLARLPPHVVAAIPTDMAVELRAIPVALDASNHLTVAMSDPSDRHAVDEIALFTGLYIVRAVATQMQIAWCLAHYYGHVTALGGRLMQPAPIVHSAPTAHAAQVTPAGSGPLPRVKGLTAEIQAQRKHALAPGTEAMPAAASPRPPVPRAITEPLEEGTDAPEVLLDATSDGVPASPLASVITTPARPQSISGEIRVPLPRAQSVKPPPARDELDESGPVITVEVEAEHEERLAARTMPVRKRKAKTDPPELAARAGEVSTATGPVRRIDLDEPRIVIALEPEPEPEPEPERPSTTIIDDEADGVVIREGLRPDPESEPVLLERRRDSGEAPAIAAPGDEDETDETDEVVELTAPKRQRRPKPTVAGIGALPAVTRASRDTETDQVPVAVIRRVIARDAVDDGWDVPDDNAAAVLGAMPGAHSSGAVALPAGTGAPTPASARDLDTAMMRSLALIRALEHAADRDAVLGLLISHLAATHRHAGFFVMRGRAAELAVFAMQPPPSITPFATLSLDRPSMFQDVIGTRLPYRGPIDDDASRTFLAAVLGVAPAEILLVPVAIRERTVGVLFADGRHGPTFDDQLALVSRAAGLALERILTSKR